VEIGTNSKAPTTPIVVQNVVATKPVSPFRGGISLKIIHLLVQIFTIPIQVTTIDAKRAKGSEKYVKEQAELIDPSFTILNSGVRPMEFLLVNLLLTPH